MARKLVVEIIGDASSLERAFGKAGKSGSAFGKIAKTAAVGVGAAFAGMAVVVKQGFDELAEGQRVAAQTDAVLKSTGKAANVTAKEVENLAGAISAKTGIDDEAIQSGQNLLLTFTNIRNEVGKGNDIFNQSTQAITDMSVALGQDMKSSAIQVGKALNDPVKGITALRRVGVSFTAAQIEQVKAMVKSGETMKAQKFILAELNKEFGGSAKAAGETFPGQLAKLRNAFDEAAAGLAVALLPFLTRFAAWVQDHMPEIQRAFTIAGEIIATAFNAIGSAITFLAPYIERLVAWFRTVRTATEEHWPRIQAVIQGVINWFRTNILPTVQAVIGALIAIWRKFGDDIVNVVRPAFAIIFKVIDTTLRNIKAIIEFVMAVIRGDWGKAWEALKSIVSNTLNGLKSIITTALRALVPALLGAAKELGLAIIKGLLQGLAGLAGSLRNAFAALPGVLAGIAAQAVGWAVQIGQALIRGIVSGLGGLAASVKDKIIGGVQGAIDGAMGLFGNSPQEVIGVALVDGIVRGWNARMVRGGLKDKMVEGVNAAIDAAQQAVTNAQGVFASAFDGLASAALSAFDKLSSDFETRTERKIRQQDERRAAAERQGALTAAQAGLTTAVAGGDPEEIKRAQQALADAQFAIQRAADERLAAQERKEYEAKRERQRVHFENQLQKLQQSFLNQEITARQFNQRLIALFKEFEVPFNKATKKLGFALADGLRESFVDVRKAARALATEVLAAFEGITIRIRTELQHTDSPGRQHGGPVRAGRSYVVGEAGPELFIPNTSGRVVANHATGGLALAGTGGLTLNFYGPTNAREAEDWVRRVLYDVGRRNPGTGL